MNSQPLDADTIAEAAIWVARLQSDQRTPQLEQDFRAWLAADLRNEAAFEAASDTWDLAGGARAASAPAPRRRAGLALAIAASIALLLSAGIWTWSRPPAFETAVGEQRSLRLADGSAVILNTATELRTRFSDTQRLVYLDRGEASFEVAHDTLRPFVVIAGNTRVVAVGTVFDVRWVDGRLAVTLAEGRVRVVESGAGQAARETELTPGQRLEQAAPATPARLATVNLEAVRAWRGGQVVFADTPLADAASEMNRYSERPLEVAGAHARSLRISGSFRAGDTPKFARALADLYGLRVAEAPDRVVLRDGS